MKNKTNKVYQTEAKNILDMYLQANPKIVDIRELMSDAEVCDTF